MDREHLAAGIASTAAELREQLSLVTAASQLLERTAGQREKKYLATLDRSICRMLRTVSRMELAYRLTDENEIRAFPELMELGAWTEDLCRRMESVLALAGVTLEWDVPRHLLLNGDERLLTHTVPEMVNAAICGGTHVKLTVTQHGGKVQITAAADGEVPEQPQAPDCISEGEEDQGVAMIRLVAQLHGGTLITCMNGGVCRSLTMVLPQRLNLPAGRLESPKGELALGGFDPVRIAFSHLLPDEAFLPEE